MTKSLSALLAAVLATSGLAAPALAQDAEAPAPAITVSGGVTLVSDYRFRGVSLSENKAAVQPTLTVTHESGFYVGVWGSNIADSPTYGEVEVDFYAGYGTEIASGTSVDLSLTYYAYPDGQKAAGPANYFETIGKLSQDIGPVSISGTVGYSWKQAALGDQDNIYLNLGAEVAVPSTPVTLVGSIGYTDGALGALAPGGNYVDWQLGADVAVGPATVGVRYVSTDVPRSGIKAVDALYDSKILFSLGFSF